MSPPSPILPTCSRRTWTEFSKDAALTNLAVAQQATGNPEASIMAVVKADGYGHGALRMAGALAEKIHSFGVACVGEAEALRADGIHAPIYLLSPSLPDEQERVVAGGFRPIISTLEEGDAFEAIAERLNQILPIQWSLDTGMGRLGTLPSEVPKMIPCFSNWRHLSLESITSHFPSADEDSLFTTEQAQLFKDTLAFLLKAGLKPKFTHICNSAGLLGYSAGITEVARAGLLLYGTSPLPQFQSKLHPVLTWKTSVTLVRNLPADWGVSYGRTFVTDRPTLVATLAAGYADGYLRHLSNQGAEVLINGRRCPILGRVTMDQIMADVSHLPIPPSPGDEVVLLGKSGDEEITANELASKAGTIPWEIYTSIRGLRK